ncbi:MAG: hypothetical protein WD771_04755 [Gemmatimonadaceae bacterium]
MSRRRCALCFGLNGQSRPRQGQIAHVDRDASNNALHNLAWLCLDHHDEYDTRRSQSKGFTPDELSRYREELYSFLNLQRRALEPTSTSARLSPEALKLAAHINATSLNGHKFDPQLRLDAIEAATGLTPEDSEIAVDELRLYSLIEIGGSRDYIYATNRFFWETDPLFRDWDPVTDASEVARALVAATSDLVEMTLLASQLAWPPRRLNPAVSLLVESGNASGQEVLGSAAYCVRAIRRSAGTKRYVRELDRS